MSIRLAAAPENGTGTRASRAEIRIGLLDSAQCPDLGTVGREAGDDHAVARLERAARHLDRRTAECSVSLKKRSCRFVQPRCFLCIGGGDRVAVERPDSL